MKKLNWNSLYKDVISPQTRNNSPYANGKELMKTAFERHQSEQKQQELLHKIMPAMQQLFVIRAKNQTPVVLRKSVYYQTSELVKSNNPDDVGSFRDVQKEIYAGTTLIYVGMEVGTDEVIFKTHKDEEILIHKSQLPQIYVNSDIYEVVSDLYQEGE